MTTGPCQELKHYSYIQLCNERCHCVREWKLLIRSKEKHVIWSSDWFSEREDFLFVFTGSLTKVPIFLNTGVKPQAQTQKLLHLMITWYFFLKKLNNSQSLTGTTQNFFIWMGMLGSWSHLRNSVSFFDFKLNQMQLGIVSNLKKQKHLFLV